MTVVENLESPEDVEIPEGEGEQETLDPERQERAKEYARIRRRLMVVDWILAVAVLLVMLFGGLSLELKEAVIGLGRNQFAVVAMYSLVFGLAYGILDAPLSYYSGFVLPHQYGLSTQSLGEWWKDQAKGVLVGGVLGLLLIEVLYWLLRTYPDLWWLFASVFLLFFTVILSNLAPVLILPLFFDPEPLEDEELVNRLTGLAERAGTEVRGVFTIDLSSKTTAANAALMGLGNTRRIVLGDTLYDRYDADEIETILAHELGHHVHNDIWIGIAVQSIGTLISFYLAHWVLRWGVAQFGFNGLGDIAAFPLLGLVLGAFGLITMPLLNTYSRWRERMADAYALDLTEKPRAFASAMTKLANQNLADVDPERWVELLLYSHPPIKKRVSLAESRQGAG